MIGALALGSGGVEAGFVAYGQARADQICGVGTWFGTRCLPSVVPGPKRHPAAGGGTLCAQAGRHDRRAHRSLSAVAGTSCLGLTGRCGRRKGRVRPAGRPRVDAGVHCPACAASARWPIPEGSRLRSVV